MYGVCQGPPAERATTRPTASQPSYLLSSILIVGHLLILHFLAFLATLIFAFGQRSRDPEPSPKSAAAAPATAPAAKAAAAPAATLREDRATSMGRGWNRVLLHCHQFRTLEDPLTPLILQIVAEQVLSVSNRS